MSLIAATRAEEGLVYKEFIRPQNFVLTKYLPGWPDIRSLNSNINAKIIKLGKLLKQEKLMHNLVNHCKINLILYYLHARTKQKKYRKAEYVQLSVCFVNLQYKSLTLTPIYM